MNIAYLSGHTQGADSNECIRHLAVSSLYRTLRSASVLTSVDYLYFFVYLFTLLQK